MACPLGSGGRLAEDGSGLTGSPGYAGLLRYVVAGWKSVSKEGAIHIRKNTRTLAASPAGPCVLLVNRTRAMAKL